MPRNDLMYRGRSFSAPEDDDMATEPKAPELSMDELRARIAAAGVTIREDRLEMVRKLLGEALAPLRRVDSRTIRLLEPAVTFDAAGPHVGMRDE
jgi:hypothetical protein